VIRHGFAGELDAVHAGVAEARAWIAALEARERERTGIQRLKVGYNKVFGYYLQVPKSQAERVPAEYERKQTLVDGERYITPDLKTREVEVQSAEERILELERAFYHALIADIAGEADTLLGAARDLGALDALAALAETAANQDWTRPELDDGRALHIEGGRHPVVERMQRDTPFVPNDLQLGAGEIALLTGPNMAGKSTVARQAALIVLLAQIGSFVPARRARIGLVDRVFARIGAQDEIAEGRSTFMVEMVETALILHHATPRSLVILDELGRGTSTYDGIAIAWAVLEALHEDKNLGCRTLFATHYHELTALAERLARVRNLHMAVTESDGGVVFLHRVAPGAADRSYGVHVAELAGLPGAVTARAWQILHQLEAEDEARPKGGAAAPAPAGEGSSEGAPQSAAGARERTPAAGDAAMLAPRTAAERAVLDAMRRLDLDALTPLDALNRLAQWRASLGREGE
jgi:DNA mismatch repair protein MutS